MSSRDLSIGLLFSLNQTTLSQAKAGLRSISEGLREMRKEVSSLAAAYLSFEGVKQLGEMADQYKILQARLSNVVKDTKDFAQFQREVFDAARDTGTPIENMVDSVTRLAPALEEMGRGQEDAINLSKTLADALELSGASAQDAAGFVEIFAKSLALDKIDQRTLADMAVKAPALMQALAHALHVPASALDDLAKRGELTRDRLVAAILSASDEIEKRASLIPTKLEKAFTNLRTSVVEVFGDLDKSAGVTTSIAEGVNAVALHLKEILEGLAEAAKALAVVYAARVVPALVAMSAGWIATALAARSAAAEMGLAGVGVRTLTVEVATLGGAISATLQILAAAYAGWQLGTYLRDNFKIARDAGYALVGGLLEVWARIKAGFQSIGPAIVLAWQGMLDTLREAMAAFYEFAAAQFDKLPGSFSKRMAESMRGAAQEWRASVGQGVGDQAGADLDRIKANLKAELQQIRETMAGLISAPMPGEGPAKDGTKAPPPPPPGADILADDLFKAAMKRAEAELSASLARRQISEQQYLQAKLDLELIEIDHEIQQTEQKRAKAHGTEKRILEEHLQELRAKRLEVEAKTLAEIGDKQLAALKLQAQKIEEELEKRKVTIQIDIQAGRVSEQQGASQLAEAERQARDGLRKVFDELANDPQFRENPAALAYLKTLGEEIGRLGDKASDTMNRIAQGVDSALTDSLQGLIDGTKSAKDAFSDFGNAVVKMIQRIVAEMLALEAINLVLGVFGYQYRAGVVTKLATGGYITGPGGPTEDKVPAMLSAGEYVMRASVVQRLGKNFFDALNGGTLPRSSSPRLAYAAGGLVQSSGVSQAKQVFAPVVTYNIDARNATPDVLPALQAMGERLRAQSIRDIRELIARDRLIGT